MIAWMIGEDLDAVDGAGATGRLGAGHPTQVRSVMTVFWWLFVGFDSLIQF